MDYFSILNLKKEPFSNSPDPAYFFQSSQHLSCLQKLELSIRLKRGLNVVIGDVGTGKTTLCRQLIRKFDQDQDSETHLILDPYFSTPLEFLKTVAGLFEDQNAFADQNDWQIKEAIKQAIFKRGVDEHKTIVLIIDEGQKIPDFCLEILREFLNFETNEYKLLQIVIFAQKEFETILDQHANVADRINLYHLLEPLNFKDTWQMIQFRINQSSEYSKRRSFFSFAALWAIYRITGGYPRKIVNLCHQIILAMIIQNKTRAGWFLVRSCARRTTAEPTHKWRRVGVSLMIVTVMVLLAVSFVPKGLKSVVSRTVDHVQTHSVPVKKPAGEPAAKKPVVGNVGESANAVASIRIPEPVSESETVAQKSIEENTNIDQADAAAKTPAKDAVATGTSSERQATANVVKTQMPSTLGRVALKHNESLWKLIVKIRGVCTPEDIHQIKKANPSIRNPNYIKAGQPIAIPAVPVKIKRSASPAWWVKIGEKEQLAGAIDVLRVYPKTAPSIHLIPYWNGDRLKFALLLKSVFTEKIQADRILQKVPSKYAEGATLLSSWPKELVFFVDPYIKSKIRAAR